MHLNHQAVSFYLRGVILRSVRFAATGVFVVGLVAPARAEVVPPCETGKFVALARLYGVARWFHPADVVVEVDWNRFAVKAARDVGAAPSTTDDVRRVLGELFLPLVVGLVIDRHLPDSPINASISTGKQVAWRHSGVSFGTDGLGPYSSVRTNRSESHKRNDGGTRSSVLPIFEVSPSVDSHFDLRLCSDLKARIPLVLTDDDAKLSDNQRRHLEALRPVSDGPTSAHDEVNIDTRIADVLVAWSILRHFYPYWSESRVNWDERLTPLLQAAQDAKTRVAHRDVMRRLVGYLGDGHGRITDLPELQPKFLPVVFRRVQGEILVAVSNVPGVRVGDRIIGVDGRAVASWYREQEALQSGSPQWRAIRVLASLNSGREGTKVVVDLQRQFRQFRVELIRDQPAQPRVPGIPPVFEVRRGMWYVDLTRIKWADLKPRLLDLSSADAVIFDVRGYPTDAGLQILTHLISIPESQQWMHVPKVAEPFGKFVGWHSAGWNLRPASPRILGKTAFLTDGRAISYAESVMGYVDALRLGEIVGEPTAGTNGNVNSVTVPSGMTMYFTGMRVTRHDGSSFHLSGVQPTAAIEPTIEGTIAGRDEVLERAVEIVGTGETAERVKRQ